jgi:cysteine desulfurase/selenocysteine lyase
MKELIMAEYDKLLTDKTKIVTVNHISNALGTVNPIKYMIDKAHEVGAAVLIDGAQAVPHLKRICKPLIVISMFSLDIKYVDQRNRHFIRKEEWLNKLPPYQGGGEMKGSFLRKNNLCGITT